MSEWSVNLNAAAEGKAKADGMQAVARLSMDQSITRRIAIGDETAFRELIEQHGESLARLIGRLTAWHAERDDILQEVLITVWNKAKYFDGKGSLEGWLKKIAINRCRNHFRTVNAIQRKIERFASILAGRAQHESQQNENHEIKNSALDLALQKLSPNDRTVLVLFYLEDMPGNEVAEAMTLKPETLHVRLHRARERLKKLMEDSNSHE